MNTHVSPMHCKHADLHHEVLVSSVHDKIVEMANDALAARIKAKITKENLFFASYGPWSEQKQAIVSNGVGYRLVYKLNKHEYCVHVGEEGRPHSIEIHGGNIGQHLPSDPEIHRNKHARQRVVCQIL